MRVADYIVQKLDDFGVKHAFVVTGGACTPVIDAFKGARNLKYIVTQHEQAASIMADAYARTNSEANLGVAIATSGPGATNLVTGLCSSWFDSTPTLFLTGQVNTFEQMQDSGVRQSGFQETDIVTMAKSVTKLAAMVTDPNKIRYWLERAIYTAFEGRQGPVLLDLPFNIQRALIDPDKLEGFQPDPDPQIQNDGNSFDSEITATLKALKEAKRPVILVGGGMRSAHMPNELLEFVEQVQVPVLTSWPGIDTFPHEHEWFAGVIGVYGTRFANYTIQNCDFMLVLGSRLDSRQTGGKHEWFGREATKAIVDIDPRELDWKVQPDIRLCGNIKAILPRLLSEARKNDVVCSVPTWQNQIQTWKAKYPALTKALQESKQLNAYQALDAINKRLTDDAIVIVDIGSSQAWSTQMLTIKKGMQYYSSTGHAPMGFAMPAANASQLSHPKRQVVAIIGDGAAQMNIQELQTSFAYNLPVKLIVMNNEKYGMIHIFQDLYFDSHHAATDKDNGYTVPDFNAVANAYGIYNVKIEAVSDFSALDEALQHKGPVLINVKIQDSTIEPRTKFGRPIEDQFPLLPNSEYESNMLVSPILRKKEDK